MSRSVLISAMLIGNAFCCGHFAAAQDTAEGSGSKVEKIVRNESLFPKDFASKVDWKAMKADSQWKIWTAVPEQQRPKLTKIVQTYGKGLSTGDELAPALRSGSMESTDPEPPRGVPTRKVRVHYFDHVGFGVDASETDPIVLLIANRPAPRKK